MSLHPCGVRHIIRTLALCCSLPMLSASSLEAATVVRLSWNPNVEVDLAGYRLKVGTAPRTYTQVIEVGNRTSFEVRDLAAGATYYFAVFAYDFSGNESPPSSEVAAQPVTLTTTLAIAAGDAPDPVQAGGNLTYTLAYSNTGNAGASGVVVTDTVPANTTFVSATGGGTIANGVITWNSGSLAAGASGSVQLVVRVNSPLANGTTLTNATYSIDSAETTVIAGAAVITTVASAPRLSISKTDGPDPVQAGGNLTYTLAYSNTGNAGASGVVVIDTVPANTTFVSATGGGTIANGVVTWNPGSLAAGASGSVQLVVRVNSPIPNGTTLANSAYSIDSSETSPVTGATVTTTVVVPTGLTINKSGSPNPVEPGGAITYTLSFLNGGGVDLTGVVVTDTVPANTTFVSATGGGTIANGVVTWNPGSLAAGASGSVQLVVRVNSPLPNGTTLTNNTYSIDSAETAAISGAAVNTTVASAPLLSISKTDGPDPVQAGGNLTYTLAYSNTGNAGASGVVVTDTVPANTTFVSATGGGTLASGVVTWNPGSLAAGASGSVQLVVRVNSPLANGTTLINATYSIDSAGTAAIGGPGVVTAVSAIPILAIAQTDSPDPVNPGASITYTLALANNGNANATGVVLTFRIPAGTAFVSATNGGTLAGSVVTWNLGGLAAGGSGSAQVVVRTDSGLLHGTLVTSDGCLLDSNETAMVAPATATTTIAVRSLPVITSALESVTLSIYLPQGAAQTLILRGSGFQNGAVVDLGPDITAGSTLYRNTILLESPIRLDTAAVPGLRTLTLTNPDYGTTTLVDGVRVIRHPDIDRDCMIDGRDLNVIARAWNTTNPGSGYILAADLDGDGRVDGDDLAIFIHYFGHHRQPCP